jgi:hypothetical protein
VVGSDRRRKAARVMELAGSFVAHVEEPGDVAKAKKAGHILGHSRLVLPCPAESRLILGCSSDQQER